MSCACEQKKLSSEYERMKRLAKAAAKLRDETVALCRNPDGTYRLAFPDEKLTGEAVEYFSPY